MTLEELKCPFEKNRWYPLQDLVQYLKKLEQARQADRGLSNKLRTAKGWSEVYDELYPIRYFAEHEQLTADGEFNWLPSGQCESGVDFELRSRGKVRKIQITTTGPIWPDAKAPYDNPGYQGRLLNEKLAKEGVVSDLPPWRREGKKIVGDTGMKSGEERDGAFIKGLQEALDNKRKFRPGEGCELAVLLDEATE